MNANAIEFYRQLTRIYDEIFPVEADTVQFLVDAGASPGNTVLDLACGSGLYTDALCDLDVNCYGVDGSPDLIDRARARSPRPQQFRLADMMDTGAPSSVADGMPESFDLVFCIGNSLSHLESSDQVKQVVESMAALVRPNSGRVVIQDVDMETIPVGGVRELPTLVAGGVRFERCYRRETHERVVFDAALTDLDSGSRIALRNELLILGAADLARWFREFGFRSVDIWGGFRRQSAEQSWVRVMLAADPEET